MADKSDVLLFTDFFLITITVNAINMIDRLMLTIYAFKQNYIRKQELVLPHVVAVT